MSFLNLRSRELRKKLLELSQNSGALHLAPAFSCLEIVDSVYRELMPRFVNLLYPKAMAILLNS